MTNLELVKIDQRIALLTERDPIRNARIINKLERRRRKLVSNTNNI